MMRCRIFTATLVLLAATTSRADMMIVETVHTDPTSMMGQARPAQDKTTTSWISSDRMRTGSDEQLVIVRMDQKKLYLVDPKAKTALSVDLPIDFKKLFPAGMEAMAEQMKQMGAMTVTVTPTDTAGKVGTFNTKQVKMKATSAMGLSIDMTFWMTTEIKLPELSRYKEMMANISELQPATAWMKDLAKLEGMAVRSEVSIDVMGNKINTRGEITSVESKPAPAGTYEIPADYTVKALDMMEMIQKQQSGQ
ncbi:MAG: DUF4412 domain-containing protein [Acidobacteriota bacterium]